MNKQTTLLLLQILLFTGIPLLPSCSEGDLSIGDDFVDTETYTAITDTFSLNLSTFRMDSVETSGTGIALCGYSEIHETKSTSYFNIELTSDNINKGEKYDSLCLVLQHSGYYLGDTTQLFGVSVHLLQEEITANDAGTLCADNFFHYAKGPVGQVTYYPEPNTTEEKELLIRIDDSFGQMLLDTLQSNTSLTAVDFEGILHGLALVPDSTISNAVLGFEAEEGSINLRLYTHKVDLEKTELTHDFPLAETTLQFNNIVSISDKEALRSLTSYKQKVPESQLNQSAILQGGTGFFARIDLPGLPSMKALKQQGQIVKATLQVGVKAESHQTQTPPTTLYLLEADKINQLSSYIVNSSGNTVTGTLSKSTSLYEESYTYTFDITYFLNALINEEVTTEGTGIVLALPEEDLQSSVDRVKFKGYTDPSAETRLNVFYYNYDKE
ncbi:uncharacterized protein DUF4270 [Marinilabilia salmonicolor]|jgi:hypothetical protein|uniref:DUF4270 family protein n=1 Tax=Marinilabilia salmonicolor TaxID=989 RepID=UPI000D04D1DD|nr:DUF4270 family protein [Marinilabilia salmonicolor]PRZ01727.1 uncharacterized protein DUF4270 [Marinilabilia salmonicolor]